MTSFVVDTRHSGGARLHPVPVGAVRLAGADAAEPASFWGRRLARNRDAGLPALFANLEAHGVLNNFRRLHREPVYSGARVGPLYTDSDLYKWMEAAAWTLASGDHAPTRRLLDEAVQVVVGAQGDDGYLNTWFVDERAGDRWKHFHAHELYCAGHLFQAAVAHRRAVDPESPLYAAALRFADLIDAVWRDNPTLDLDGHPEIEMALVELARESGEPRYRALARHLLDKRRPAERNGIWGHAVRALYYLCGVADDALDSDDASLWAAAEAQWHDLMTTRLYVTGGVGGRYTAESVGAPYELPNERAYAETCAAIASVMFNWRMLQRGGEARFADALERSLYNGFLSGVSLAGTEYFYMNPLACSGVGEDDPWYAQHRHGACARADWHTCTCCPPNVQRMLASLPAYLYSVADDGVWAHLYAESVMHWHLPDGAAVTIQQTTAYPFDGAVTFTIEAARAFTLWLRVPAWAGGATLDGEEVAPGSYAAALVPAGASTVRLSLPLDVIRVVADERVVENRGAVAVQRGPLVYCLEGVDHAGADVRTFRLRHEPAFTVAHADMLDGVVCIGAAGLRQQASNLPTPLYRRFETVEVPALLEQPLTFIPYYAWANRGAASMTVWIVQT